MNIDKDTPTGIYVSQKDLYPSLSGTHKVVLISGSGSTKRATYLHSDLCSNGSYISYDTDLECSALQQGEFTKLTAKEGVEVARFIERLVEKRTIKENLLRREMELKKELAEVSQQLKSL